MGSLDNPSMWFPTIILKPGPNTEDQMSNQSSKYDFHTSGEFLLVVVGSLRLKVVSVLVRRLRPTQMPSDRKRRLKSKNKMCSAIDSRELLTNRQEVGQAKRKRLPDDGNNQLCLDH